MEFGVCERMQWVKAGDGSVKQGDRNRGRKLRGRMEIDEGSEMDERNGADWGTRGEDLKSCETTLTAKEDVIQVL